MIHHNRPWWDVLAPLGLAILLVLGALGALAALALRLRAEGVL